ncbi:MAG: hypothetical protein ACYTGC_04720 [Planctomycetota bacterium]|jgi:hypothetical protein
MVESYAIGLVAIGLLAAGWLAVQSAWRRVFDEKADALAARAGCRQESGQAASCSGSCSLPDSNVALKLKEKAECPHFSRRAEEELR